MKNLQFNRPLIIITSNLVPLIGILFFHWDAFNLIMMFFVEFMLMQVDWVLRFVISEWRIQTSLLGKILMAVMQLIVFPSLLYGATIICVAFVVVFFVLDGHSLIPIQYAYGSLALALSYLVTLIKDLATQSKIEAALDSMFGGFDFVNRMGGMLLAFSTLLPAFFLIRETILRLVLAIGFKIGLELYAARKNAPGSPTANDPASQMKRSLRYFGQMK